MDKKGVLQAALTAFLTVVLAIVAGTVIARFIPNLLIPTKSTITVTGEAQEDLKNQIATFNATVTTSNDDKQKATDETNTKMTDLINSIKDLGIGSDDLKTQSINVYQQPSPYPMMYPIRGQVGSGAWVASNTITITVRDLSKVSPLADLLNKSGATNIYGPNYTVDNTTNTQADVLAQAIENARKKAEKIASASGRSLGKATKIDEGSQYGGVPVPFTEKSVGMGGGTTTPVEPGTQTIYKTVTVTFELK